MHTLRTSSGNQAEFVHLRERPLADRPNEVTFVIVTSSSSFGSFVRADLNIAPCKGELDPKMVSGYYRLVGAFGCHGSYSGPC